MRARGRAAPRAASLAPRCTRREASQRLALSLVLALSPLAACGEAPVPTDAALADAIAELHLADAVAERDSLDARAARALRARALAAHGLDSAALADRLRGLAEHEGALGALYDSVALRLTLERQGVDRSPADSSLLRPVVESP